MLLAHSTMCRMLEKNTSYDVNCCLFYQSSCGHGTIFSEGIFVNLN